jgi:hypothetical protein
MDRGIKIEEPNRLSQHEADRQSQWCHGQEGIENHVNPAELSIHLKMQGTTGLASIKMITGFY